MSCTFTRLYKDGKFSHSLSSDEVNTWKLAFNILTGKRKYIKLIEVTRENHDWEKGSFEESGSLNYFFQCNNCGEVISRYNSAYKQIQELLSNKGLGDKNE